MSSHPYYNIIIDSPGLTVGQIKDRYLQGKKCICGGPAREISEVVAGRPLCSQCYFQEWIYLYREEDDD